MISPLDALQSYTWHATLVEISDKFNQKFHLSYYQDSHWNMLPYECGRWYLSIESRSLYELFITCKSNVMKRIHGVKESGRVASLRENNSYLGSTIRNPNHSLSGSCQLRGGGCPTYESTTSCNLYVWMGGSSNQLPVPGSYTIILRFFPILRCRSF